MNRLQSASAALALATTPEEVAQVVLLEGAAAVGATHGVLCRLTPDGGALEIMAHLGISEESRARYATFPLQPGFPLAEAVQTRRGIFIRDRSETMARYPALAAGAATSPTEAWGHVPLEVEGRAIGGISWGFDQPRDFAGDERVLMETLARQCAQAMERARLREAEERARAAWMHERERFHRAFSQMPGAVAVYEGPDHVARVVSDAYREIVGGRDIVGQAIREALPELEASYHELLDRVYRTGEPATGAGVAAWWDSDGDGVAEEHLIDFTYQPLRAADGSVDGIVALVMDETAWYRAQQHVAFVLELSRRLGQSSEPQEIAEIATSALRERLGLARCSLSEADPAQQALQVVRQSRVEAPGTPALVDLEAVGTGAAALREGRAWIVRDTATDPTTAPVYDSVYGPVGSRAFVVVPLLREGRIQATLAAGSSVPRDWRPDEIDLVRRVADRAWPAYEAARALREAERARAAAEQANRAKSEFLATMSHELRTPLNAIAGYVDLLLLGVHGPVNAAQAEALDRVKRSEQHLLGLINDVLNYARVEAGKVEYRTEPVPVALVMEELEGLLAPQLAARQLDFQDGSAGCNVVLLADREKVEQVLLNLVGNAMKFTPAGGRIRVTCDVSSGMAHIRVADTGTGIPADRLEDIFAPFVQVSRTLSSTHQGTGLGLAISRDLARGMGGDITVESEPGVGSTFTVALPVAGD